jgi:hypothetical protein
VSTQTNYYKSGRWNIICDVCGFKFKSDEVKKRWDGLFVCKKDFELDHPQKYLRIRETGIAVPYIREPNDEYLLVCNIITSSGYADMGVADCMKADNNSNSYAFLLQLASTQVG